MTTETDDRVTKLLTETRTALDDLGIRETADESDADDGDEARALELTADLEGGAQDGLPEPISSTDLPSLAEEAHELVEEGDVQSLLERVGLDTLPDGSTPSSLPEAIAHGDPGQVATLRALQRLASLADPDSDSDSDLDDADSLEETVLDLYGLLTKSVAVETGDEEAIEAEPDASDDAGEPDEEEGEAAVDEDEADEDEMGEEGKADQKDEDETDESEESTSESDSEPAEATDETDGDSDLEDSISSALKNAVGGFGDEVESLKAGLEAAGIGDDEEADAEDEADSEDEEADEDEDDGLLSIGDDSALGGSSSGRRRGTMHSTVARSPSKRADMKAPTRHSTMPKRN